MANAKLPLFPLYGKQIYHTWLENYGFINYLKSVAFHIAIYN
ncbi:uncharacterized protein Thert_01296 [Thermoanaerobacterium thermosaccharolyticum]|uniref:Uncharacterized protein n=1 Tax=Thermoanaerobacterium thermosaccharolyticum TaxID=1517 RepID=A0A223HY29_THETR|nr:uncharacterized protein Thert_01296 [Thermoanaerobacterium thermosaccharolyticum]